MENKPKRSVAIPDQSRTVTSRPGDIAVPGSAKSREATRWAEDTQLSDMTGRIIPGDPWWLMAFDDPSPAAKEKPIRLLPNQVLETALSLTAGGTRNVVLIFSGEVTACKGNNYLLLRKVLVRRDLGNFR